MPGGPRRRIHGAPGAPGSRLGRDRHALPGLPARAADGIACRAAERGRGRSVTTVERRRAAIRTLHFIGGRAVPTAAAQVAETMAGMHRTAAEAGRLPARKRAATAAILRQILVPIPPDLAGLRLTLPHTKGERTGRGVTVAVPYGTTEVRSARSAPGRTPPGSPRGRCSGGSGPRRADATAANTPLPRVGAMAIDAGTVARIIQSRAARAGFDPALLGGHSLKRGALRTGMALGVHPTRLKQLGRHKSDAVLDVYLELGDPFESHPLNGVL
jgi:hypothetical protein